MITPPLRVTVRADAGSAIGAGHVMRCLALAQRLRARGHEVAFVCRPQPGDLIDFLTSEHQFPVHRLDYPVPCDSASSDWVVDARETSSILDGALPTTWIVVDHYGLDERWEALVRLRAHRLMVVDDMADRPHMCDVLLDHNLVPGFQTRYEGLAPSSAELLLGPKYALIRDDVRAAAADLRPKDGTVRRLLVFFSGPDPENQTCKAIDALRRSRASGLAVDVIIARMHMHPEEVQRDVESLVNGRLFVQPPALTAIMASADLCIGASGSTSWERCCLGLPSVVMTLIDNQEAIADGLASAGAALNLGLATLVSVDRLARAIDSLIEDSSGLRQMGERARRLVDGQGADRVVAAIERRSDAHWRETQLGSALGRTDRR
jgi:UDP-2,4-diacetamido-2,4,6-trideoxy-beta-L-altropyranose hydrolase